MINMIPKNPLQILCFGDSLTAGYSGNGTIFHPYADALQSELEKALPRLGQVFIDVQGLSGDMAISPPGRFMVRIEAVYKDKRDTYSWAVILGGTNDLGMGRLPDEIYEALKKEWSVALENGSKVLAVTVPECGFESPKLDKRRDALNNSILTHQQDNFFTFNLHDAVPYWNMPEEKRSQIWDDLVHFTEAGYDLVGSLIAQRIAQLVNDNE